MKIKQVKKVLYEGCGRVETSEFNRKGLITYRSEDGIKANYVYDEGDRLIRVDKVETTSNPNEAEIRISEEYVYDGLDFRVLEHKTHSRTYSSDWEYNKQLLSVREVYYTNQRITLDKKHYLRKCNNTEYTKYKYSEHELIYKEAVAADETYVIEKYEGQNLVYKEQKFQYYNDDEVKVEIIKTDYLYDIFKNIIEEREFINDCFSKTTKYTYLNSSLTKRETYYPLNNLDFLDSFSNYTYDSQGRKVKIDTYQLYKEKIYLVAYEEFIYDDDTTEHRAYWNESFEWTSSMTNIRFGLCHTNDAWSNFTVFGDSVKEPDDIEGYKNSIAQIFAHWNFDKSSKSFRTLDHRKNLIKEEIENRLSDHISTNTTINHFEYNEKGDLEFQVSFYNGFISEILKNYYSY